MLPTDVVGNATVVGFSVTIGACTPVPVSDTDWGDPTALPATVNLADNAAAVVVPKETATEQEAPTASDLPQVLSWWNENGLFPPMDIELIVAVVVPTFLSVATWAVLVVFTTVAGNEIELGDRVTAGAV
jgi:hypothetical protein